METFNIVESLVHAGCGAVTRRQLQGRGITDRECLRLLQCGRLVQLEKGVYSLPGFGAHVEDRYRARIFGHLARHCTSRRHVLTGQSACVLRGLPLWRPVDEIYLGAEQSSGWRGRGVKNLGVVPENQTTALGIVRPPLRFWSATVARSLADAARTGDDVNAVCLGDAALRRGLVELHDIDRIIVTLRTMKGVGRARMLTDLLDAAAESAGESVSRLVMRRMGVPAPQLQQIFYDADGEIGRVDFWWKAFGVIGEFDGLIKYGRANPSGRPAEDVLVAEKIREDRLRALGYIVVRWTAEDLRHPERLLRKIQAAFGVARRHKPRFV